MSSRTRWLILAFALTGFGLATASAWVHYRLLTDPAYISPCDVNASFNCSQVYLSRYGSVGGVPVAIAGLVWFGLAALLAAFARPDEKKSVAAGYLFALSLIGLGVAIYLAYASFFVLQTGCLLCIGTYVCVLAIFVLSSFTSGESVTALPARLFSDLGALVSRPGTLATAVLFLAGAASVVAFFPREGGEAPQAAAAAAQAQPASAAAGNTQEAFADAWAKQPRIDLGIPADGAKVIIVKFNDFECGGCAQAEMFYKPVLQKFAASHPGAVKYVVKDWPWDTKCNFNAGRTIPGHEAACDAAAAARMARDRGKYDEMAAWLYANQGARPDAVRAAAARIAGVTDFDREYALKLPGIRSDIADGGVLGIGSTPTYFVNGVRLNNTLPTHLLELAINLELQKAGS
jgi:vitamin-K-epoxide reductase (warfarin-sensitive)